MSRRKARETALQMLFQLDVGQNEWQMAQVTLDNADLTEINKDFAAKLVLGARENMQQIDLLINSRSREWNVDRLANVDKNILRLAIYELEYDTKAAESNIVINEAIELAKKFSTEDSGSFVNAVLDNIKKTHHNNLGDIKGIDEEKGVEQQSDSGY
ncbi:MAG: transcription antitermination factor NusB [Bacillota bacterium]|jgi:N utilization substance protein B